MIRFIHCVKRRPDLSLEEFRHFWNSREFDDLLRQMAAYLGVHRLEKNLTLAVEINRRMNEERGADEPFDGIFEFWVENARNLMDLITADEGQRLLKEMEECQRQFVDFTQSRRFYTEWNGTGAKPRI